MTAARIATERRIPLIRLSSLLLGRS